MGTPETPGPIQGRDWGGKTDFLTPNRVGPPGHINLISK